MYLLEMNHVRKTFDDVEVLKDISLKVKEGQVVAIIGPSGSGKSTFLNAIIGNLHRSLLLLGGVLLRQQFQFVIDEINQTLVSLNSGDGQQGLETLTLGNLLHSINSFLWR